MLYNVISILCVVIQYEVLIFWWVLFCATLWLTRAGLTETVLEGSQLSKEEETLSRLREEILDFDLVAMLACALITVILML